MGKPCSVKRKSHGNIMALLSGSCWQSWEKYSESKKKYSFMPSKCTFLFFAFQELSWNLTSCPGRAQIYCKNMYYVLWLTKSLGTLTLVTTSCCFYLSRIPSSFRTLSSFSFGGTTFSTARGLWGIASQNSFIYFGQGIKQVYRYIKWLLSKAKLHKNIILYNPTFPWMRHFWKDRQ